MLSGIWGTENTINERYNTPNKKDFYNLLLGDVQTVQKWRHLELNVMVPNGLL